MKSEEGKSKFLVLLISTLLCSNIIGQTEIDSAALKSFQIKPILEITTYQANYIVNSQLTIHGRVINLTDVDLFLTSAEVILAGEYQAARGESENEVKKYTYKELKEQKLTPGDECSLNFIIPFQNIAWYSTLLNSRLLTFQPKNYEFIVVLNYRIATKGKTSIQKLIEVKIEPPMSSLIWGGILGSLLLAIFLGAYKFSRSTTPIKLKDILKESAKLFVAGSISAIIIVILLYRYKDFPLPINITINDFYGGIVLGLFTYSLGDLLYKKLKESKESEIASKEEQKEAKD